METQQLVIIGSGPAGYTAGLYAARAKLNPILFSGEKNGGQLMWTTVVENYPGFEQGVDGPVLMNEMRKQAIRFGTDVRDQYVTAVDFSQRPFKIWTTVPEGMTGEDFEKLKAEELEQARAQIMQTEPTVVAKSIIVSTGAVSRMLGVPNEDKLLGRGVSTCAVCDAAFFKDKVTYIVGGGDSAMEDTLALTKFAKQVYVVHRRDKLRASQIMQDRVLNNPKVKILWNTQVKAILGENKVEGLTLDQNGKVADVQADGFFLAIGHIPVTSVFGGQLQVDEHGYLVTRQSPSQLGIAAAQQAVGNEELLPFPTMTSIEGVFAAGDVVDMRYQQAVTAAAQGCAAALDAERWLERQAE